MDIKANRGLAASVSPSDNKAGVLPSFPDIAVRTMAQDLQQAVFSKKSQTQPAAKPEPVKASELKPAPGVAPELGRPAVTTFRPESPKPAEPAKSAVPVAPVFPRPAAPSKPVESIKPVSASVSVPPVFSRPAAPAASVPPAPAPRPVMPASVMSAPPADDLAKQEEKKMEEARIKREQEEKARLESQRKEKELKLQKERAEREKAEIDKLMLEAAKMSAPVKTVAPPPGLPTEKPVQEVKPVPAMPMPAVVSDFLTPQAEPALEAVGGKKKWILLAVVLLAALLSAGGWIFWRMSAQPVATATPTLSAAPSESASPSPSLIPTVFFRMDGKEEISFKTGDNLAQKIQAVSVDGRPAGSFIQIVVSDENGQELDLVKVASAIKADLFELPTQKCETPEKCAGLGYLKDDLNMDKYSIFYYSQAQAASSPFNAGLNQGRLGLIVALNNSQSTTSASKLERTLEQLEPFMASSFGGLFLGQKIEAPIPPAFQENIYRGVKVRYMNLPSSELTIDYAVLNGNLLFATSKESMFGAIDRLLEDSAFSR